MLDLNSFRCSLAVHLAQTDEQFFNLAVFLFRRIRPHTQQRRQRLKLHLLSGVDHWPCCQ